MNGDGCPHQASSARSRPGWRTLLEWRTWAAILLGSFICWGQTFLLYWVLPLFAPPPIPGLENIVQTVLFIDGDSLWTGLFSCILFWSPSVAVTLLAFERLHREWAGQSWGRFASRQAAARVILLSGLAAFAAGMLVYWTGVAILGSGHSSYHRPDAYLVGLIWADTLERRRVGSTFGSLLILALIAIPMLTSAALAYAILRPSRIRVDGRYCPVCDYCLEGCPSAVCPECGTTRSPHGPASSG